MGVDLVTINGDIERMNTVFKFYLHIWLALRARRRLRGLVPGSSWSGSRVSRRAIGALPRLAPRYAGGLALAAAASWARLIYPVVATPVRLDDRFVGLPRTLDGMAYMQDVGLPRRQGHRHDR